MRRRELRTDDLPLLPQGGGWLLVEFGGDDAQQADDRARRLVDALGKTDKPPDVRCYHGAEAATLWDIRKSALGATAHVPGMADTWPGWEDAAVPPQRVGNYLRDFRALLDEFGYACSVYGHFGDGCIHARIDFDLASADGIARYRQFIERAADLVIGYGGSLSGEHGDGQARGALLPKMYGEELMEAFRQFKRLWDPQWKMNPGKLIDADPPDTHLRQGADYAPLRPHTWFAYDEDRGDFSQVALRCVGVGKCRKQHAGTMCPSYMATRDETHSTRGRARILFEMLQGEVITDSWRSQAVFDALDLCLACKGCKGECPVNVDMATYKAEFLAHYYQSQRRPREAYAFGYIHRWARLARFAPALVNALTHAPGSDRLAKWLTNVHPQRKLPRFARRDFRRLFVAHGDAAGNAGGRPVLLWPDTFNAYLQPHTLLAGVRVQREAGYRVLLPQALETLAPMLREAVPVVGLEPTCIATFRDELPNLLPHDERAQQLSQHSFLLTEFLAREQFTPPRIQRRALVHAHCNHKAVFGLDHERALLDATGLDYLLLDAGCCGMAGAFGYEKEHYEVSLRCGERVLLPSMRAAGQDTLLIADGYSCREHIAQQTGRKAVHLAQAWAGQLGRKS